MTGWPWPLDAVQDWFEALWNYISETVWAGINAVGDWLVSTGEWIIAGVMNGIEWAVTTIKDGLDWVYDRLQEGIEWIVSALEPLIIGIGDWLVSTGEWIVAGVSDIINGVYNFLLTIPDTIRYIVVSARDLIINNVNDFIATVQATISGDLETRANEIKDRIRDAAEERGIAEEEINAALNQTYSNINTQIELSISGLWDSLTGLAGDILSGAMTAFGDALSGFVDWLLKHLSLLADMIIGAVRFIVDRISDAVTGLISWLIDGITGAMMPGSPPKEIERASNVLIEASFKRQFDMIDEIYQSEPSSEGSINGAVAVMGGLLGAGTAAMALGIAADQVHPLKNMGWRPTVREIVYWAGIPSVTAAIATLPSSIGLLTPLRYALYEKWQPRIPDASDLITFAVREVFITEQRERLIQPGPGDDFYRYMAKQGYSKTWAESFWAAHWRRPTVTQLNNALYRDIITEDEWKEEVRLNDVVPYSIPWLNEIIFNPYTRVDIRRMWDMRVVSEDEIKENYLWLGYDDEHAEGMTLWTKVYVAFPDLIARYRNGWITAAQVLDELIALGMPESRAIELMQTKIKPYSAERVESERDLTKSEIVKGAEAGIITRSDAVSLLLSLGYEEWEAEYILILRGVVEAGDPEGYWDMRKVTEAYKKSQGLDYKTIPDELIELEKIYKEKKAQLDEAKSGGTSEDVISQLVIEVARLEKQIRLIMQQHDLDKQRLP